MKREMGKAFHTVLMKKFATIYGIVIGMAVLAGVIGIYHAKTPPTFPTTQKPMMTISSPAFENNGNIPAKFTCTGEGVSPELHIAGVPENAKSLALILHDPDAPLPGGFMHWVVWNIPATTTSIGEHSMVPGGSVEGKNGAGKTGYIAPCPPSGMHRYFFKLFALDTILTISSDSKAADLESAMQGHILQEGEVIGLYKH